MILQALADYYEQLSREHPERIARPGWCSRQVAFMLELSPDGELVNVIPAEEKRGWTREVPEQAKRTVGVTANLLCDNATYLLGLDAKGKPERARRCFDDARRKHLELLADVDSPVATAIRSYFETWNVEERRSTLVWWMLARGCLREQSRVLRSGLRSPRRSRHLRGMGSTLRTIRQRRRGNDMPGHWREGSYRSTASCHQGVMGAQSMGASLVGFNARAFESYGHDEEQG